MTLSDFILANIEQILQEWERFAQSLPPGENLDTAALRDHAEGVLRTVVEDLRTTQNAAQEQEKSLGRAAIPSIESEANRHGTDRAQRGFDINQMFAEFRALRASVIRLWAQAPSSSRPESLYELTRFNEAIDQALAESSKRFTAAVDHTRDLFIAVLGHDLRTPMGSIMSSAEYLEASEGLSSSQVKAVIRILRSGSRVQRMVADVLDVTRQRLEGRVPAEPVALDVGLLCRRVIEESEAYQPTCKLVFKTSGDLSATWDQDRITRLLSNLVENAIRHGTASAPITVSAAGKDGSIEMSVHNTGAVIPTSEFQSIFDPLARGALRRERSGSSDSLGLGLYIVRAIAHAHGGEVALSSEQDAGTTFTVRLPRKSQR